MTECINEIDKAKLELDTLQRAEKAEHSGGRQVWQRMPQESAKAYAAFSKYRDMAERRTMARVAEMSGCSSQNVERWARRWAWTQRTYEYDLVQEENFREQASRDRVAHRRRQIQIGQALQSVAVAGLNEWRARLEQKLPLNLQPEQIATLLKLGDELEARGLGEDEGLSRFTRIVVNLTDALPLPDTEEASQPAVLCDETQR